MANLVEITTGTTQKFLDDINNNFTNINEDLGNKQTVLNENQKRAILYGFDEPDNSWGNIGDIYIQITKEE